MKNLKLQINEIEVNLENGIIYGNHNFSFIYRKGSDTEKELYLKMDLNKGNDKFFVNKSSFILSILNFIKTGY